MRTFVIAEAGSAWRFGQRPSNEKRNGMLAIQKAKACGASAVKFQFTSDPRKMEQRRSVRKGAYDILAWPADWLNVFSAECESVGIEFMCTVYLSEDVEILNPFVKRWKIASLEADDNKLANEMDATGKEIIISLGASKSEGIAGFKNLHCTLAYPAPLEDLNLKAIGESDLDGYSDHSADTLTGAIAVACGAKIVEVHFRLHGTPKTNPDYKHSLTPESLERYVENIRKAEMMLGNGIKNVRPSEFWAANHMVTV